MKNHVDVSTPYEKAKGLNILFTQALGTLRNCGQKRKIRIHYCIPAHNARVIVKNYKIHIYIEHEKI